MTCDDAEYPVSSPTNMFEVDGAWAYARLGRSRVARALSARWTLGAV